MSSITNDQSLPIVGYSPFEELPEEVICNIFSFVDVKGHGRAAQVSQQFNRLVNSGAYEGKNAREYLLGKVGKIDFTFTHEDFLKGFAKALPMASELLQLPSEIKEDFTREFLELLSSELQNINLDMLEKIKSLILIKIKNYISDNKDVNNNALHFYIENPSSEESKQFIKSLALETFAKVLPELKPQEREDMGINIELDQEKLMAIIEKYQLFPQVSTGTAHILPQPLPAQPLPAIHPLVGLSQVQDTRSAKKMLVAVLILLVGIYLKNAFFDDQKEL